MTKEKRVITLLTDFGLDDEYVGVMKGVILSLNREALIVDISHQIRRHDVAQAALVAAASFSYFPRGSVHVVVVDPGVGGNRRVICVESEGHYFLTPDNGVLSLVLAENEAQRIHAVTDPAYFLMSLSDTFHGRDLFAPVAAHLAGDLCMTQLGDPLRPEDLVQIDFPKPRLPADGTLVGRIVSADHFGNLITNIDRETLRTFRGSANAADISIQVGRLQIDGISKAYTAVPVGHPVAVVGSKNRLEISINQSDAGGQVDDDEEKVILRLK